MVMLLHYNYKVILFMIIIIIYEKEKGGDPPKSNDIGNNNECGPTHPGQNIYQIINK